MLIDGRNFDINRVATKLHQGGKVDPTFHYAPYDMIVLCAQEFQPELPNFRGMVLRPAFDDTWEPTTLELARAIAAAALVATAVQAGRRVLVTCRAGWNRSGLVTGLALGRMGLSGDTIVNLIRQARGEDALCNPTFEKMVRATPMRPGSRSNDPGATVPA